MRLRGFTELSASDVVVSGGVLLVMLIGSTIVHGTEFLHTEPVGLALLVVAAISLSLRERFGVTVLVVTAGCAIAYYAVGYPAGFEPLPVVVALYALVSGGRRVWGIAGAVVFAVAPASVRAVQGDLSELSDLPIVVLTLCTVIVIGELARSRRAYTNEVELRAESAEATREEEARRRVAEERLRISRDLHDVIAHNIAMINVQSGAALLDVDDDASDTARALRAIREASGQILRDTRETIGSLRDGQTDHPERDSDPGVAAVHDLIARTRSSGLAVDSQVDGRERPLGADGERAAYRVVQESLTNVIRHAGHASVRVRMTYGEEMLEIDVCDDGDGPRSGGGSTGHGLRGLRERLDALGGGLSAGPGRDRGFRVHARIPLDGAG